MLAIDIVESCSNRIMMSFATFPLIFNENPLFDLYNVTFTLIKLFNVLILFNIVNLVNFGNP